MEREFNSLKVFLNYQTYAQCDKTVINLILGCYMSFDKVTSLFGMLDLCCLCHDEAIIMKNLIIPLDLTFRFSYILLLF